MGFTRNRLHVGLTAFFLALSQIYGGWNEAFLEKTYECAAVLELGDAYLAEIENFKKLRVEIEDNALPLAELGEGDKKVILKAHYVCKKRPRDNLNEPYFWELAHVLSLTECVTPSFPFKIGNTKVIVQPFERFSLGSWIVAHPRSITERVSLRTYFRAHLLAFILGADDLSGMNIGVTKRGAIRFFDNEDVFCDTSIFMSVAFDWAHYRKKIGLKLAQELNALIAELVTKKSSLDAYATLREVSVEGVVARVEQVAPFHFDAHTTFLTFYSFLYPTLSEGLDELGEIVGKILHRKVDHGIALFFAFHMVRLWSLSDEDQAALDGWEVRYSHF